MKKQAALLIAGLFAGSLFAFSTGAHAVDTNGIVDYTPGSLTFDPSEPGNPRASLPTDLNFGSHPIQTTAAEKWVATADGDQASAVTTGTVAVSDNRGTNVGWNIKIAQPEQFMTSSDDELEGALLVISTGALTNNVDAPPTGNGFIPNSQALMVPGETGNVLTANAGQGAGETKLALSKFELNVPANTSKVEDQYQTTLVWTFSATPS